MTQWVPCPQCNQHYQFPETATGKQLVCPKCGQHLVVGAAAPAPAPAPAPVPPPLVPLPEAEAEKPLWALPVEPKKRQPVPSADRPRRKEPAWQKEPQEAREKPPPGAAPDVYVHKACGGKTKISLDVVARMTGDPFGFISGTWCAGCQRYVRLGAVAWDKTGENVAVYRARLRRQTHPLWIGLRFVGGPLLGALIGAVIGAAANSTTGRTMGLGALAGVVIGLPLGYFVGGITFQIGWWLRRRK